MKWHRQIYRILSYVTKNQLKATYNSTFKYEKPEVSFNIMSGLSSEIINRYVHLSKSSM